MFDVLIQSLFGWPAMILSLVFAFAGIVLKKRDFSLAGTVLVLAPAWYLSHYSLIFALFPILLFGAACQVSKGRVVYALALTVPVLIGIAGLAVVVLSQ
jgi:hypothetical protein